MQLDIIIQIQRPSSKAAVILATFKSNFNFLGGFSKNAKISNSMKIRPLEAELLHAEGRLIVLFEIFANSPE
jgi:hypothetical protein